MFWLEKANDSLLAATIRDELDPDICKRPRSWQVDIRRFRDHPSSISFLGREEKHADSGSSFQLAMTIVMPPEPLKYGRRWPSACKIPATEKFVEASSIDARMPHDAIPVSYRPDEEVSACLKVNANGNVADFKLAHPVGRISDKMAKKIEQVARKCWNFDNHSGAAGWIQVGLDKRKKANSL
ncbi:hypothetical protein [Parasphingorhabdus marina]|nr:hypothetical protein [Parasphingorhabdus marina]